jgi:hypothetical protein
MEEFLRSIPAAAGNPYALAAYAISAVLFLFAGVRLRMAKLLMAKITSIPEADRRRALEIATGTVLPLQISPEQWIRHNRLRWTFLLFGSILIVISAVSTIAILNPAPPALKDIKEAIQESNREIAKKIDTSTDKIVTTGEKVLSDYAESQKRLQNLVDVNLERLFDKDIDTRFTAASVISNGSGGDGRIAPRLKSALLNEIKEIRRLIELREVAARGIGWGGMDNGSHKTLMETEKTLSKCYKIVVLESQALQALGSAARTQIAAIQKIGDTTDDQDLRNAIHEGLGFSATKK